jgi:lipopolysaccharide export system permease protein
MKKIDKLIIKSFLGPLLLTFALAVFVLLMNFLWKYVDDLVGRGLDMWIIAKLLFYAAITFVPMALPIATLFASIMTMGNFGEKYELVAMKAGGISVRRIMMPLVIIVVLITILAFGFANNIMPYAVLQQKRTLYSITNTKPAINIKPSEYYQGIEGYVIRIDEKDKHDDKTLYGVTIYDHTEGMGNNCVTVAEKGEMLTTPDGRYMIFNMYNGYSYREETSGENWATRPMTRIKFDRQQLKFDLSGFDLASVDDDFFKGSYQMMNILQLDEAIDTLEEELAGKRRNSLDIMKSRMSTYHLICEHESLAKEKNTKYDYKKYYDTLSPSVLSHIKTSALHSARMATEDIGLYDQMRLGDSEYINKHYIEWHQKFTLSFACFVLFLIGAPFGSIIRKGGLGWPLVASVVFFLLYYVITTIARKAIIESALPTTGMWISTAVLLPIGILLTLKATTDSPLFDASSWRKFFEKHWPFGKKETPK